MNIILFCIFIGYISWIMREDAKAMTNAYFAYYSETEEGK